MSHEETSKSQSVPGAGTAPVLGTDLHAVQFRGTKSAWTAHSNLGGVGEGPACGPQGNSHGVLGGCYFFG